MQNIVGDTTRQVDDVHLFLGRGLHVAGCVLRAYVPSAPATPCNVVRPAYAELGVEISAPYVAASMGQQISLNVRYLLWTGEVPREQWASWVTDRTSLGRQDSAAFLSGAVADADVRAEVLRALSAALDVAEEDLRFADMPRDSGRTLHHNLQYLFDALEHGGKSRIADALSLNPTTVSRWLNGSSVPRNATLRQLVLHFGLPAETDLRETPIFLSTEPVASTERRQWVHERVDALSADELRDLFPALRRILDRR